MAQQKLSFGVCRVCRKLFTKERLPSYGSAYSVIIKVL